MDEAYELTLHLESLRSVYRSTNDIVHRQALELVIIYLAKRLLWFAEQEVEGNYQPWPC